VWGQSWGATPHKDAHWEFLHRHGCCEQYMTERYRQGFNEFGLREDKNKDSSYCNYWCHRYNNSYATYWDGHHWCACGNTCGGSTLNCGSEDGGRENHCLGNPETWKYHPEQPRKWGGQCWLMNRALSCPEDPKDLVNQEDDETTHHRKPSCLEGRGLGERQGFECRRCKPGKAKDDKTQKCVPCDKGQCANESGASRCTLCEVGTYIGRTGATGCNKCVEGTYAGEEGLSTGEPCN